MSMGSLIVGFSSGYTSPALISMNSTLHMTKEEVRFILLNNNTLSKTYLNFVF